MQAGASDGRAGQQDRLELGDGRQLACLADLDGDPDQSRDGLLGLVLEGDGPARALAPRAEAFALAEVVYLDHQSVRLEVERVAPVAPLLGVLDDLLDRLIAGGIGADGDTPALHQARQGVV